MRLHFTPGTAPNLFSLIDLINSDFGEDSRFKVAFKAVSRLGGENDHKIELFSRPAELETMAAFQRHLRNEGQLITHNRYDPQICYAAKPNSFVIRADGRIAKCTVALYDDRNTVGHISEDGRILIDNRKLQTWMRGFKSLSLAELGCPLHSLPRTDDVQPP